MDRVRPECPGTAGGPVPAPDSGGRPGRAAVRRGAQGGYGGESPGRGNATLAGWLDFAFDQDGGGGLGVAIERRWTAAHSDVGYDVTRYYDAGDWLQVLNLWGKTVTVNEPQTLVVYLIVHAPLDLRPPTVIAPAEKLWNNLRARAFPVPIVP